VHTFAATLKTAGTQSITVKDAATATAVGSQTGIVVNGAAAVASVSISGFPATTAGAAQTFTVTARDAFGNVCIGYTGTVIFSSSDVQAGLPASYTFTAADAGAHTFTATLKTAGTQSITVKDAANSTLVASQTGITVSAGAVARFSISAPATVTQGVGFKLTMTVLDAYGNVVTGYVGKVHLSSTDSKGGTSDYTFSSRDNGVHIFSYTFNTLGLETLNIVDTTNNTILGSAIVNVVPKS
jgi:trimeric autotransporter adhesin